MEHGWDTDKEGGHGWGERGESSALTPALRAATIAPRRGRNSWRRRMPVENSALTQPSPPGEGEGGGALGSCASNGALAPRHFPALSAGLWWPSVLERSRKEAPEKRWSVGWSR